MTVFKQHSPFRNSRRDFFQYSGLSLLGASCSGWFPALAEEISGSSTRPKRSCILLWMSGGPSQMETFDPKPGHENGGPTKAISSSEPSIQISENLPGLSTQVKDLAIIRSMSTKEGDHARATHYLKTGYLPQGPVQYPCLGSFLGQQLQNEECPLPSYVSINPFRAFSPAAFGPGFLGPSWSPLVVAAEASEPEQGAGSDSSAASVSFQVRNLKMPERLRAEQMESRLGLLSSMERRFLKDRPGSPGVSHLQSYQQAVRMMKSGAADAFDLESESAGLRDSYGRNPFGQGCLLARRLIEKGVAFVEVCLNGTDGQSVVGWDSHQDNFTVVKSLCQVLDPAWTTLMKDLRDRGLLESTLIVWMGEFGRTPKINENTGRDHWPSGWSAVLGGGGIRGGQVVGDTGTDGTKVSEPPVTVPDLIATVCRAVDLNPETTNLSNIGRPIPLADHGAKPLTAVLK